MNTEVRRTRTIRSIKEAPFSPGFFQLLAAASFVSYMNSNSHAQCSNAPPTFPNNLFPATPYLSY